MSILMQISIYLYHTIFCEHIHFWPFHKKIIGDDTKINCDVLAMKHPNPSWRDAVRERNVSHWIWLKSLAHVWINLQIYFSQALYQSLYKEVVWGLLVSLHPSFSPSFPHAVSALWHIAYFMDYIHMWHQYKPWGDDVLQTIFWSTCQRSRSQGSFELLWLVDHRSTSSSLRMYIISHCLRQGHETMVSAVCLSIYFWTLIGLRWVPKNQFDGKSALFNIMACCNQAICHYLNQCGHRCMAP